VRVLKVSVRVLKVLVSLGVKIIGVGVKIINVLRRESKLLVAVLTLLMPHHSF